MESNEAIHLFVFITATTPPAHDDGTNVADGRGNNRKCL